jgi:hypothetical protein
VAETLLAVKGLETTSGAFKRGVVDMSRRLGANPDFMDAVMAFETGYEFTASKRNPKSKAVGLIQFTKVAADELGTTRDALGELSAIQQLRWVEKYFRLYNRHRQLNTSESYGNLANHYLIVFAPVGVNKPADYVLYAAARDGKKYSQNARLDTSGDGTITVREAVAHVAGIVAAAKTRPRLPVAGNGPPPPLAPKRADLSPVAALIVGSVFLLGVRKWRHRAAQSQSLDR